MSGMDHDLEERFAQLKRYDRGRVPAYERIVGLPRPRRRPAPLLVAALLVVALGGGLIVKSRGSRADAVSSIADWTSPTAGLLHPPGSELMSTVPSVTESVITLEAQ